MTIAPLDARPAADASDAELFAQMEIAAASGLVAERPREVLIRRYEWLVRWAARRYGSRGEELDELQQVGYLGLVEAIVRFDPDRGVEFARSPGPPSSVRSAGTFATGAAGSGYCGRSKS